MPNTVPDQHAGSAATTAGRDDDRDRLLEDLLLEKYEPIAMIGIGVRFPGGNATREGFASFLRDGGLGTGPVPADRWDRDTFAPDHPGEKGRIHTAGGGFLTEGIDQFDPQFFNISPKEANYLDPQQRLVLEASWEALEDANLDPARLRDAVGGVYVGVSCVDYTIEVDALRFEELDAHIGTGTAHSAIPGRVSYFLGWRGPSMAIDTACSSSLAALHLAVEGLRRKECDIALCGGVNAIHHPRNHVVFSQAGMLAPDGRCKTFDDSADGYSRSEGCGMVLLKRLSDAQRDGDEIIALVRGTAVRQDGASGGLTVPNGTAQEAVMRAALTASMLEPSDIAYVEAHGTGTSLGDPIEMGAIRSVFARSHSAAAPLVVGSLKTNLGHMESAAGIGGVIKAALQSRETTMYRHLHLDTPSGHIPWQDQPIVVPIEPLPWPTGCRRALVNSFGFAGSIASAVIEQAPARRTRAVAVADEPPYLIPLSGRTPAALAGQVDRLRQHLVDGSKAGRSTDLAALAATAAVGRSHFDVRSCGVVEDAEQLDTWLEEAAAAGAGPAAASGGTRKTAFMFTGQGSQYPGMGRWAAQRFPTFAADLAECSAAFEPYLGQSVADLMLTGADSSGDPRGGEQLHQTRLTQPALFALEYSLARLWISWGVTPDILIGHSIGEVVAATVSGLLSLPDAVNLVAVRAQLMQSVRTPGGMLAVRVGADAARQLLVGLDDLAIAAVNSPDQCVFSGATSALEELAQRLTEEGVPCKRLTVSHPFHSPLMHEVFDDFRAALAQITFHEPHTPMISNVTGRLATPRELSDVEYWVRHIGEPVLFADGIATIAARGRHDFIEIGPAPMLIGSGQLSVSDPADHGWYPSLRRDDPVALLRSVGELYQAGQPIDWAGFYAGRAPGRVDLPKYAFQRKRYWLPLTGARHLAGGGAAGAAVGAGLLGTEITDAAQQEAGLRIFRGEVGPDRPAYLADHVVMGQVVFPAAGYVEVLLELLDELHGDAHRPISDLAILEPLILAPDEVVHLYTRVVPGEAGALRVEILTAADGTPGIERMHVRATLLPITTDAGTNAQLAEVTAELARSAGGDLDAGSIKDLYPELAEVGLEYGPQFRSIEALETVSADVVLADIRGRRSTPAEQLPPPVLDAVIQSLAGLITDDQTYLPVRFGQFKLLRKPRSARLRSVVRLTGASSGDHELTADLLLLDGDQPVMIAADFGFRKVTRSAASARSLLHLPIWTKRSLIRSERDDQDDRSILLLTGEPNGQLSHDPLIEEARDRGITVTTTPARALAGALAAGPTDIVWCWRTDPGQLGVDRLRREAEDNYTELLAVLNTLQNSAFGGENHRLWLVTPSAQDLPGDRPGAEPALAASVWGFGATAWTEFPSLRISLVDLDGDAAGPIGAAAAQGLLDEIQHARGDEYQVAFRAGVRHVRRIAPAVDPVPEQTNLALEVSELGSLSNLHLVQIPDVAPVGDEIQVRIHAAGINFKDVLNALGLLKQYSDDLGLEHRRLPLGFEGAGRVVAVGPEAEFAIGDEVMVSHLGCLRRRVTVSSALAVRKPVGLGFAQAAGLPTAFITAHHALHRLAGVRPGQKILIHAAAGGVGQAAVQLAKRAGLDIYATASPRKHALLRSQGITRLFNSRTTDFADQVLAATGGEGVDVVMNSLNKDFVDAGMRVVRPGGCFVELGKIGVWTAEQAADRRPDVSYFKFDLSELPAAELQALNRESLSEVADLLAAGQIEAVPTTVYDLSEAEEAFSVLSRGASVGKLVISLVDRRPQPQPARVRSDRAYLITGGLGALAVVAARKLVAQGARRLVLVGRREVEPGVVDRLAADLGPDVDVEVISADVSDPADMARLTARVRSSEVPLGGILHTAGVLADGPVATMSWDQIDTVFLPKVYGSWLLHELASSVDSVDFFVGYSSIAAPIGPAGQANYAAGNAFLDALLGWRHHHQQPGISLNWGPWAEVGMAASLDRRLVESIESGGMRFLRPSQGTRALVAALSRPEPQLMVAEFDWQRLVASRPLPNAIYSLVARSAGGSHAVAVDLDELKARPSSERRSRLNEVIRAQVAALLQFDSADEVRQDARFLELGLDSLAAVELKNRLELALKLPLPVSVVFDYPTVDALAEMVDERLVPPVAAAVPRQAQADAEGVLRLSDTEAEAELAALRAR